MEPEKSSPLEDAVVRAAVRFVDCMGEFDGKLTYCAEWLDALETAVINLEKSRDIVAHPPA
jgi:hypothetical protein